ncbi:MAG: protein kinase [Ancrocorticia sp.]
MDDSLDPGKEDQDYLRIPLAPSFRYIHEPQQHKGNDGWDIGSSALADTLVMRIVHSSGGAFLFGGFRGVGKTSLINKAISDLLDRSDRDNIVVLRLNVARPVPPQQVLYSLVRGLYEELERQKLFKRLPRSLKKDIRLCYLRTAASVTTNASRSVELALGGSKTSELVISPNESFSNSLNRSLNGEGKVSVSRGTELAYLAYGLADAEQDLVRILGSLAETRLRRNRIIGWFRREPKRPVRVIAVLDELDKLTSNDEGLKSLLELVVALKNLLTTCGLHVICVAGVEAIDLVENDTRRGNGIFESLFGWTEYIPCTWDASDLMVRQLLEGVEESQLRQLVSSLQFQARGNSRRAIQRFNQWVTWEGEQAYIELKAIDQKRMVFYARLNETLSCYIDSTPLQYSSRIISDRFRLAAYLACEWAVFYTKDAVFTVDHMFSGPSAIDEGLGLTKDRANRLFRQLVKEGILVLRFSMENRDADMSVVFSAINGKTSPDKYQLSDETQKELSSLFLLEPDHPSRLDEEEPYFTYKARRPSDSWDEWGDPESMEEDEETLVTRKDATKSRLPEILTQTRDVSRRSKFGLFRRGDRIGKRWVLEELLKVGATGTTYSARDIRNSDSVIVKILDRMDHLALEERDEFEKSRKRLCEAGIVGTARMRDVFVHNSQVVFVYERIRGTKVSTMLQTSRLSRRQALRIGESLLRSLSEFHKMGYFAIDLKPSNIFNAHSDTYIIDFELATTDRLERWKFGSSVGTPRYMAPEQLLRQELTYQADIYSFGATLFELLSGRPWNNEDAIRDASPSTIEECLERVALEMPISISPALRTLIADCLLEEPHSRPASAQEALNRLLQTEEGGSQFLGLWKPGD